MSIGISLKPSFQGHNMQTRLSSTRLKIPIKGYPFILKKYPAPIILDNYGTLYAGFGSVYLTLAGT